MPIIQELLISNFKSVAGQIRIGRFGPFVNILGENGSGKSNLFDAMAFVLGESTQNLRCTFLQQLVNNQNPTQPCFVRLSVDTTNNGQGELSDDSPLKVFEREIVKNKSIFMVDNESVSKEEYMQRLAVLSCSSFGQNLIVRQNFLLRVANSSSEQLFSLMEVFAGCERMGGECVELIRRLAEQQTNLNKSEIKLVASNKKLKFVRSRVADLKKHRKLFNERKSLSIKLALAKLYSIAKRRKKASQSNLDSMDDQIEELDQQILDANADCKVCQSQVDKDMQEMANLKLDRDVQQDDIRKMKDKIRELRSKREILQSSINLNQRQLDSERCTNQKAGTEIEKLNRQMAMLTDEIGRLQEDIDDRKRQALNRDDQLVIDFGRLSSEMDKQVDQIKGQHSALKRELDTLETKLHQRVQRLETFLDDKKSKEEEMDSYDQKKQQLEGEREIFEQNIYTNLNGLAAKQRELDKTLAKFQEKHSLLSRAEETLFNAKIAYGREKKRDTIERLMKEFPDRVIGRLENLCTVADKRFRLAFQRVYGPKLNTILVDEMKTAYECIRFLTNNQLKAEYFVALKEAKFPKTLNKLRVYCTSPNIRLIVDCLRVHSDLSKIRPAISFIGRDTFVCATLKDADAINEQNFNAVTLNGTFFSKNGDITTGSAELEKEADALDERQFQHMQMERKDLQESVKKLRTLQEKMELEMRTIESEQIESERKLRSRNVQIDLIDRHLENIQESIVQLDDKINRLNDEIQSLADERDEKRKQFEVLDVQISSIKTQVFQPLCKKYNLSSVEDYENQTTKCIRMSEEKLSQLKRKMAALQAEHDLWNARLGKNIPRLENELKLFEKQVEQSEDALNHSMDESNRLEEELDKLNKKRAALLKTIQDRKSDLAERKKAVDERKATKRALEAEKERLACIDEVLAVEREQILRSSSIHRLDLPLKKNGNFLDLYKDDPLMEDAEFEFCSIRKELDKCNDDVEKLKKNLTQELRKNEISMQLSIDPEAEQEEENLHEEIQQIKREILAKKDSWTKTSMQLSDLRRTRDEHMERFIQQLTKKVDQYYKQLYRSPAAMVIIDHYLNPLNDTGKIIFGCTIPGKKACNLDELSSGEKCLAALALSFALNTSPWLLLDEFDAYLDADNCVKVCSFIEASKSQYDHILVISHKDTVVDLSSEMIAVFKKNGQTELLSYFSNDF